MENEENSCILIANLDEIFEIKKKLSVYLNFEEWLEAPGIHELRTDDDHYVD